MATERTRSEYRLTISSELLAQDHTDLVHPDRADADALAHLMLDGYHGTIDDEGENLDDARAAIDHCFTVLIPQFSFVLFDGPRPVGMSLVIRLPENGVHYIDPVVVAGDHQQRRLGTRLVQASVSALARDGVDEVGAAITDGNAASEHLFSRLGARRIGPWPPDEDDGLDRSV